MSQHRRAPNAPKTEPPSHPDFYGPAVEPDQPTAALPHTPEKVTAMQDRADRGEQLFRQGDAEYADAGDGCGDVAWCGAMDPNTEFGGVNAEFSEDHEIVRFRGLVRMRVRGDAEPLALDDLAELERELRTLDGWRPWWVR